MNLGRINCTVESDECVLKSTKFLTIIFKLKLVRTSIKTEQYANGLQNGNLLALNTTPLAINNTSMCDA